MSTVRRAFLALALFVPAVPALAHPHSWIDLESRLVFDEAGRLERLWQGWLFDEFYTAFIAEEFVTAGLEPSAFLEQVAAENLANLRAYDYFTELKLDGEPLALGELGRFASTLKGERLWLEFEVALAEPVDPAGSQLSLAVFDPTYYIEILHAEGHSPELDGIQADCSLFVMPPTPTPEQIAAAFMLDVNETGENGLGRHFAEIATVDCR